VPEQDGSALLISLMLIFIMTLLGLALFDLGVIENRMTAADEADARALEIANAGVEQAIRVASAGMVVADTLADFTLYSTTENVYSTTAVNDRPFLGGGTYTLEQMNVSSTSVNGAPFGLSCIASSGLCKDLTLIRARGSLLATGESPSATYGRVRAIQVLLRAETLSPFAYAVTAETPGPNAIRGLVAGSINFLACTTCNPFGFDSSSVGQRNNYFDLRDDPASLSRIDALQTVCSTGSDCGTRAFSLGATLRISGPTTAPAVATAASLGQPWRSDAYTHDGSTFAGKGPLDNVFVADGCSSTSCTDNFTLTGRAAVNVSDDNLQRPYPRRPARSFPLFRDPVRIGSTTYDHYACLSASPFTCSGGSQFINTTAAVIDGTSVTTTACDSAANDIVRTIQPCPVNLGTLFADGNFENRPAFAFDISFTGAGGPVNGRLCWTGRRSTGSPSDTPGVLLLAGNGSRPALGTPSAVSLAAGGPCLYGSPIITDSLSTTGANPLVILLNGDLRFGTTTGNVDTISYRGAAIFVVNGTAGIDAILQTHSPSEKFPNTHMLSILSSGDMGVGLNKNGIDRVMALLYTERTFRSGGRNGHGSQNTIIGTVAARMFCFAKGCTGSGPSDETRLFQAGLTTFPDELLPGRNRWTVVPVQKSWRECAPLTVAPSYTFPIGMCPY
jgi:Tfp pilus assembly protein PilX